jgi:hypothetical protein
MYGKIKPVLKERGSKIPGQKGSRLRAFSAIPKMYLQKFLKNNKRNRGIKQ